LLKFEKFAEIEARKKYCFIAENYFSGIVSNKSIFKDVAHFQERISIDWGPGVIKIFLH